MSWVPQMNRTELRPQPRVSSMRLLYSTISGLFLSRKENKQYIEFFEVNRARVLRPIRDSCWRKSSKSLPPIRPPESMSLAATG